MAEDKPGVVYQITDGPDTAIHIGRSGYVYVSPLIPNKTKFYKTLAYPNYSNCTAIGFFPTELL